jgi:hypothetical protein
MEMLESIAVSLGKELSQKVFIALAKAAGDKAWTTAFGSTLQRAFAAALSRAIYSFSVQDPRGWADAVFPENRAPRSECLVAELAKLLGHRANPMKQRSRQSGPRCAIRPSAVRQKRSK